MLYKIVCFIRGHKFHYTRVSIVQNSREGAMHVSKRTEQIAADHCVRCGVETSKLDSKTIDKIVNNNATDLIKHLEDHLKGK